MIPEQARHASEADGPDEPSGGDSPAGPPDFSALYEAWFHEVCRWLRALGGPDADLEDLAQEVFLVAQRRFDRFDGRNPAGWLYQIARRVAGDARRRWWWKRVLSGRSEIPLDELVHSGAGPAELLERREGRKLLHRLLEGMTEKRRVVLILSEIEGYSTEEIAKLEGLKPPAVLSRLHYARRDFLELLEREHKAEQRRAMKGPTR